MGAARVSALLIQFARAPQPGAVKTRLIPSLGAEGACNLHQALVRHTCQQLLQVPEARVQLWVAGDTGHALFTDCLAAGVESVHAQRGADLGERMAAALREGLASAARVLLVGSDCPGLDPAFLGQALARLENYPVVLGPARDGGYVLVGSRQPVDALFDGVPWGSDRVLVRSLINAREAGWEVGLLPGRVDIDRPEDLLHCPAQLLRQAEMTSRGAADCSTRER